MTHVRTSPYYPQSKSKIERWHKSRSCVRLEATAFQQCSADLGVLHVGGHVRLRADEQPPSARERVSKVPPFDVRFGPSRRRD